MHWGKMADVQAVNRALWCAGGGVWAAQAGAQAVAAAAGVAGDARLLEANKRPCVARARRLCLRAACHRWIPACW